MVQVGACCCVISSALEWSAFLKGRNVDGAETLRAAEAIAYIISLLAIWEWLVYLPDVAGCIKKQERDSCLSKPLAAENFLPSAPSSVGPTRLFPTFLLEYGMGLTIQHLLCLPLSTRLWRIWKRRSPITCTSFIVCTVLVLEMYYWMVRRELCLGDIQTENNIIPSC